MNKTVIRNFAVWARKKLIADVSYHAGLMGITKNGIAQPLPQSTRDVEFFDIGTADPYVIRGEKIKQRKSLINAILKKEKDSSYLNSNIVKVITPVLNPTLHFKPGDMLSLPYIPPNNSEIMGHVNNCINLSKQDWDSFETSWDFKKHPLV